MRPALPGAGRSPRRRARRRGWRCASGARGCATSVDRGRASASRPRRCRRHATWHDAGSWANRGDGGTDHFFGGNAPRSRAAGGLARMLRLGASPLSVPSRDHRGARRSSGGGPSDGQLHPQRARFLAALLAFQLRAQLAHLPGQLVERGRGLLGTLLRAALAEACAQHHDAHTDDDHGAGDGDDLGSVATQPRLPVELVADAAFQLVDVRRQRDPGQVALLSRLVNCLTHSTSSLMAAMVSFWVRTMARMRSPARPPSSRAASRNPAPVSAYDHQTSPKCLGSAANARVIPMRMSGRATTIRPIATAPRLRLSIMPVLASSISVRTRRAASSAICRPMSPRLSWSCCVWVAAISPRLPPGAQTSSWETSMSRSPAGGSTPCSWSSLSNCSTYRTPLRLTPWLRVRFWMVCSLWMSRCEKRRRLVEVRWGTTRPMFSYIISVRGCVSRISEATLMV